MSNLLLKEKYQIVKAYLNEIDPSFKFITFPIIDPNNANNSLKILHLKSLPTLSYYKIIESDLDQIIDLPFVTNQNLMALSAKYIESLKIDREVMTYNQKLRSVQVNAHKDLLRIFLEVKNIVQNIEKNLTLERKGSFIDLLFTNIKQLNVLIAEAQLIYQALSTIEIRTSIDLLHYVGLFSEQQNSKLLIAFNYDENAIEMMDFQDHVIQVLEESYTQCAITSEDSIAAKSAHLALQMKNSLEEGKQYFQLCSFIYLEFKRMNFYTREELKKLEPYIAKINKNICEILYLHFIKKRETEKIKDLQIMINLKQQIIVEVILMIIYFKFKIIAKKQYYKKLQFQFNFSEFYSQQFLQEFIKYYELWFAGQVKEVQLGIREPLDSRQNMEIVKDIYRRSNQLLLELRHCKEVYNLYTGECFTAFFERKKMKRKNTIKSLKNEILLFQQTLAFIEEIIRSDGPLRNQIQLSIQFIAKVSQLEITFQEIISKKQVRSKIPLQNTEINKIRGIAKQFYSDSEDVIVELKRYQKQFEQYYDVSYISIFEHLFEKTFFNLKKTLEQLYEMQEKIILILQKESKILGGECSQIHQETEILLKDIYDFLQQIDSNVVARTDNKNFLDEIGSNILKILVRLKKKQAQIEINLQDKSLIVSHKLSQELYKMCQSLDYQLTNLEGLGIVIESRQYFNSAVIVDTMYEFLENDPKFTCLDQILQDLPEHKKDVEQFIQEYYSKVSQQLKILARDRIELEQYFFRNFSEMKQCHSTMTQCHKLYNEKYKGQIVLFDQNFINVVGPIISSYQKISNIIIDLTTSTIFQEELKKKLRDSLNKYINKIKQQYATDEMQQIHKSLHAILFYGSTKEKIIQSFLKQIRDNFNGNKDYIEILKSLQETLGEFFTVIKDVIQLQILYQIISQHQIYLLSYNKKIKWIKVLQKHKGQGLNIINIEEYNTFVESTFDLEDFFLIMSQNMQSMEQQYELYQSEFQSMLDPIKKIQLKQYIQETLEDIMGKYKYEFDENIKQMAIEFVKLGQNLFQLEA